MSFKRFSQAKDRLGGNREARRVQIDGYWFDSAAESELYVWLKNEKSKGVFHEVKCQDVLYLSVARFMMKPDFRVTPMSGEYEWHEMKGNYESEQWKRNTRLWRSGYGPFPGAKLTVWKKNRRGIYVWKVIVCPEKEAL